MLLGIIKVRHEARTVCNTALWSFPSLFFTSPQSRCNPLQDLCRCCMRCQKLKSDSVFSSLGRACLPSVLSSIGPKIFAVLASMVEDVQLKAMTSIALHTHIHHSVRTAQLAVIGATATDTCSHTSNPVTMVVCARSWRSTSTAASSHTQQIAN